MGLVRVGIGCLCVFVASLTSVRGKEIGGGWESDIASWSAGVVIPGNPSKLQTPLNGTDAKCEGMLSPVPGGVSGVELRRKGSCVLVVLPWKGKLWTMSGWIPASRWRPADSSPQAWAQWVGVWQNETAKITVQSQDDGQLDIKGHAVRDLGIGTGEIFGDFEVVGRPQNGVVTGDGRNSGCKAAVRLLGDYLVVDDNGACGGIGVSFFGMYRLRHH